MVKTKKATPSPADEKVYDGTFTYKDLNGNDVEIKYRNYITLQEMGSCIHGVADSIVDSELGYFPYLYDIVLYSNLLEVYTDFDVSIGTEAFVETLYKTNLQDVFEECVINPQFETIITSIDELIEFKKQQLATKSEIDNIIVPAVKSILDKVNSAVDTFSAIDSKTLESAMGNLAKISSVDENNVIQAFIKQSDVKNKSGRKASSKNKSSVKDSVVELPITGQIDLDGNIYEDEPEDKK